MNTGFESAAPGPRLIDPGTLKNWLDDDGEIALFDVREHGLYGAGHLFFAVPLPYSRLELDIPRLAPRPGVRVVLYGDDDDLPVRAARQLDKLGYRNTVVLKGGAPAWEAAGFGLFAGVNVPSKAFGELVEQTFHTPHVSADELSEWMTRGEKLIVLDGRPFEEYGKMNIPGGICCPNGELAYRLGELVDDPDRRIVINCAGRTRSILGAQTLVNLGIPNPVYALENGTQGWMLADLPLEHGSRRRWPDGVPSRGLSEARKAAGDFAFRHQVPILTAAAVIAWLADDAWTTFLFDVRTAQEFQAGTLAGARHAPGGQLIQATDQFVGVRRARIVLFDDEMIRAPVVAAWLRLQGHDATVLEGGLHGGLDLAKPEDGSKSEPPGHSLDLPLAALSSATPPPVLVDVRPSRDYRQGHARGALWSIRPRLAKQFAGERRTVVVIGDDPALAHLAARELLDAGISARTLGGGYAAWIAAGLPVEATPAEPPDSERIDFLFFTHDRHEGNKAAARQYLAWELGLLERLDRQELASFRLKRNAASPGSPVKVSAE
ncbi:rhodanese-like domain-containing protein [Telmatospirillum siberiense]|uniref:Sulfurtransferase n=1 Tax=Telmatospirillum siberiense TaxID=382514 RepID=A0A2N3Q1K9_9PROT|nr:rhodanese-like domain-containing protein [Telmatospirillum siberiense]PKU26535.1 sulfurtransferase [Telmatospirillum siberiense]